MSQQELLKHVIVKLDEAGIEYMLTGSLASSLQGVGQFEDAWIVLNEAFALVEKTHECYWGPDLHRINGELLREDGSLAEAEASMQRALEAARHQHARSLEVRAAMSLARLWQSQGKRKEAHDLLAPIYNWFTEGFDTKDLKEAKALLEDLGG